MEKKVIIMEKEKKTKNIIKKWENKDFLLNLNNHITKSKEKQKKAKSIIVKE